MKIKDRTSLHKSKINLWFVYLQQAHQLGLDVNWKHYAKWGTKAELTTKKFNTWWRETGQKLFKDDDEIKLVNASKDFVTVRIPAHFSMIRIKKELGEVYTPHRNKKGRGTDPYFVDGTRLAYSRLVSYQRLLAIQLKSEAAGKQLAMWEKIRLMEKGEARRKEIAGKASNTSRANAVSKAKETGKKKRARTFTAVEANFESKKLGYSWLNKAKKIAANVAKGQFPGPDYYYK